MKLIFVCPKCGADLEDIMLLTDPPKPAKRCNECGWWWRGDLDLETVRVPFTPPAPYDWNTSCEDIPECCKRCKNHPSNGGSGICMCALPYFSDRGVTC